MGLKSAVSNLERVIMARAKRKVDWKGFQAHSPKWSTNPIAVMGSIIGFLYYCYGSHYGNGSSKYRGCAMMKKSFPDNSKMIAIKVKIWVNDQVQKTATTTKVQVYEATRPKISWKCYVSKYTNQKSRHSHLTSYHVTLNQLIVFKQKW